MTTKTIPTPEMVNEYVESQVEYYETHEDSGDGYAHMPAEGSFAYEHSENNWNSLVGWCELYGVDTKGLDGDELADCALECFEMVAGHIYYPSDVLILSAFPISEHEIQLDDSWDCTTLKGNSDVDSVLSVDDSGQGFAYVGTDAVWYAVATKEGMQEAINNFVES